MSLEDRFRQAFDDAIAEVRARLAAELTTTLTDVRAEWERDKAAALTAIEEARNAELAAVEAAKNEALAAAEEARQAAVAEARSSLESELLMAFQSEKDALASGHQVLLLQVQEAADGTAARLREEATAEVAALRNDLELAQAEALREREELLTALAQAREQASAEFAQARQEGEAALAVARNAYEGALDAQSAGAVRVLESVRALDGATSLTEVLDALAVAAAKEAGRSAMLVLKGDRLIGWRTSGFGELDQEPRSIEASTAEAGALAAAVNTGRPAAVGSGSILAAPAFSQLPPDRSGLAVPLLVAGRPVAVLYADTGETAPLSSAWTSAVEVLVRHAGRCLEAMAVARGAHAKAAGGRVGMPA